MEKTKHPLSSDARINRDIMEVFLADLLMTSTVNVRLGHIQFTFIDPKGYRLKREYPLAYFGTLSSSAVEEETQRIRNHFRPNLAGLKE